MMNIEEIVHAALQRAWVSRKERRLQASLNSSREKIAPAAEDEEGNTARATAQGGGRNGIE